MGDTAVPYFHSRTSMLPPRMIECVMAHELVHLLERGHTERFTAYMDQFLPQWRLLRDELNRGPLAHETWEY